MLQIKYTFLSSNNAGKEGGYSGLEIKGGNLIILRKPYVVG